MMETILQLDYTMFEWINQDLQNGFLDWLMPWWRSKETWLFFYVALILFFIIKYRLKGFYLVVFLAIGVGVSDMISSKAIKKTVQRSRPCKHQKTNETARVLVSCGSGYSFTSSHATNHFCLAVLLILTICRRFKYLKVPLLLWAFSIAIGQVYVGVHFPMDILAGALLGSAIAWGLSKLYWSLPRLRIEQF